MLEAASYRQTQRDGNRFSMSVHTKVHNNTAVSASGSSAVIPNFGSKRHVLNVVVSTAPTGTTPTITYAVQTSNDGITFNTIGAALAALNAVGQQRTMYGPGTTQGVVAGKFIKIIWTVAGTTPNFPNITAAFRGVDC